MDTGKTKICLVEVKIYFVPQISQVKSGSPTRDDGMLLISRGGGGNLLDCKINGFNSRLIKKM